MDKRNNDHDGARNRTVFRWRVLAFVVSMSLMLWGALAAHGQTSVTGEQVRAVARQLTCPLCADRQPLDQCTLRACEQLKQRIAEQLASGMTTEAILSDFVDMYGPQVLLSFEAAAEEPAAEQATAQAAATAAAAGSGFSTTEALLLVIVVLLSILVGLAIVLLRRRGAAAG